MSFDIERLTRHKRAALVAHYLALPLKDRSLRFGTALAPTLIASYVDDIDFARDGVFGVCNDRMMLVGVAHVAIEDPMAEIALSVLPSYRARGMGTALFALGASHASDCGALRLLMHCGSANTPVMRIAHRFGMDIFASGGDADAYLDLQTGAPLALPAGAARDSVHASLLSDALS